MMEEEISQDIDARLPHEDNETHIEDLIVGSNDQM